MPESVNYGINATTVSAQNVAVGHNARIDVSVAGDPRLSGQLDALLRAIEAFDGQPAMHGELAAAGEEVAQALEEPAPDKERVLTRLATVASAAGSAGAIASAATALAAAVQAVL
jgi:hypothetical protein